MNRRNKRSRTKPPGGSNALAVRPNEAPALSSSKRRWFLLLLAIGLPLAILLALEAGLRCGGYGYPTTFFLSREVNGQPCWVNNWQFGWRFFPRELARMPYPLVVRRQKPPGTIRVFVLGESAALGIPAPEYGFSRMLGALLRNRFPDRKFEVINVSVVAINSHAILPIARECAKCQGNLWVVYMGNNEVIGPFGAHGLFGAQAPPTAVVKTTLALRTLRIGQLMDASLSRLRSGAGLPPQWQGMQMWKTAIAREDPRMRRVWHNFQQNLRAILRTGGEAGVPIVLSTVASNLKDCSPFASVHRPDLSAAEQASWESAFHRGLELEATGRLAEALAEYEKAALADDHFAELQFHLGRCCLSLGRGDEARQHFQRAKDEDALQFRPDTRLNEAIRTAAAAYPPRQARLLDAEELFAQASPQGIPGEDLFYEHVHLTPAGNYLLAKASAQLAAEMVFPDDPATRGTNSVDWLSEAECESQIGLTDWGRLQMLEHMQEMLRDPPFTTQSIHANRIQRLSAELKRLRPADRPSGQRTSLRVVQAALARQPADADLLRIAAGLLENVGDDQAAERRWREVITLLPHAAIPYLSLAKLLNHEGRQEEAAKAYEECLRRDFDNFTAHGDLGALRLRQDRPAEAIPHLRALVHQQPQSLSGHYLLGQALLHTNQRQAALAEFTEVLDQDPANEEAKQMVAELSGTK